MKEELTYEKVIDSLKEKLPSLPQILQERPRRPNLGKIEGWRVQVLSWAA